MDCRGSEGSDLGACDMQTFLRRKRILRLISRFTEGVEVDMEVFYIAFLRIDCGD